MLFHSVLAFSVCLLCYMLDSLVVAAQRCRSCPMDFRRLLRVEDVRHYVRSRTTGATSMVPRLVAVSTALMLAARDGKLDVYKELIRRLHFRKKGPVILTDSDTSRKPKS